MATLRRTGRGIRFAVAIIVATCLLIGPVGVASAADLVTFGQPSATSSFGKTIDFKQPVTLDAIPLRVEVLIGTPGDVGPSVVPVPPTASGATTLVPVQCEV